MFLAVSLASLVLLLLIAALSVAWLALPGGRFCPRCGGPSHPVRPRRWIRPLDRLLQWRWCAGCGWEGPGRPPKAPADPERKLEPGDGETPRGPPRPPVFRWTDAGS